MVKAFFAAVVLVFASPFGLHHAPPAAVAPVAIVQSPSVHSLSVPSLSVAAIELAPTKSTPTVVPAAIRSSAPAPSEGGLVLGAATAVPDTVTHAELNAALDQLGNSMRSQFFSITASGPSFSGTPASTPVSFQTFATSQKIDQLANITITNATMHGVSGLTAADIPTNLVAANYLPLTGGTLSGSLSLTGGAPTQDRVVLADALLQIRGFQEVGFTAVVSTTGGAIQHGGPTYRTQNSSWQATAAGQSLTLTFPGSLDIHGITFGTFWREDNAISTEVDNMPKDYAIDYSTDGTTWTNFVTVTNNNSISVSYFYNVGGATQFNAKYLRITVNAFQLGQSSAYITGLQVLTQDYAALSGSDMLALIQNNPPGSGFGSGQNIALRTIGGLGIGTTTVSNKLTVEQSGAGVQAVARLQNATPAATSSGAQLLFGANRNTTGMTSVAGVGGVITDITAASYKGALAFYTANNAAPAERARFDNAGDLGLASTSPWRTLSVTGSVGFDGLTANFGAGSLCLTANKEVVYNAGSDNCLSSLRSTKHDINPLAVSATSTIAALSPVSFIYSGDASSTVRYGFIAEDTAAVDQHLATYDQSGALTGVDDRAILSVIVRALQELIATVSGFAENFATQTLVADNGTFKQITTDKLCVTKSDGSPVCITGDALDQMLSKENVSPVRSSAAASVTPAPITPTASSSPDTARSTATTTTDAPSIVPEYNATTTLPSAPAASSVQ